MKRKIGWLKKISNILFILTIGFTLYLLVDFIITRGSLPQGMPYRKQETFNVYCRSISSCILYYRYCGGPNKGNNICIIWKSVALV